MQAAAQQAERDSEMQAAEEDAVQAAMAAAGETARANEAANMHEAETKKDKQEAWNAFIEEVRSALTQLETMKYAFQLEFRTQLSQSIK